MIEGMGWSYATSIALNYAYNVVWNTGIACQDRLKIKLTN